MTLTARTIVRRIGTARILNAGDQGAHVTITIFFTYLEPAGPYAG